MRVLGIDFGDARIGLAVSDPFGWTAQGIGTIHWKNDVRVPIKEIKRVIDEYNIQKIVVGMPKNLNNTLGERARRTEWFISVLKESIDDKLDIIAWDERCSTISAKNTLNEMGVARKKKKGMVDRIAAYYILQSYLDCISNGKKV